MKTFCAICGEAGNDVPHSMAGQHHKWGPRDHEFVARKLKMKLPRKSELRSLLIDLKKQIGDEDRASEDDTLPSMCVTVGCDLDTGEWGYQTGDNSFTGGAYLYRYWAVIYLYRRSNSTELAQDILHQLDEQYYEEAY